VSEVAFGGILLSMGLVGGGVVIAVVVLTTIGGSKAVPVVQAVAVASSVASHVRDGLARIPRARMLPFGPPPTRVVFVPAPTVAVGEIEVVSQPHLRTLRRTRVDPVLRPGGPRGSGSRARIGPHEGPGPRGAALLPVQSVAQRL